jgi:adenylate cyclase
MTSGRLWIAYAAVLIVTLSGHRRLLAQDSIIVSGVPVIHAIKVNSDSLLLMKDFRNVILPGGKQIEFSSDECNLAFIFEPADSFEYRFFLDGFDKKQSGWLRSGYKEYTNLPSRNYTLHTWFRGPDNEVKELSPLLFSIKPAWFLTGPAKILYLTLIVSAIAITNVVLIRKFKKKQRKLEEIIANKTNDLLAEKEKTEKLLQNVLPKEAANELMEKGKTTKIKYNFVTVLFSDIQGFTKIAEEMNPEVLIDELDKFFFHFDTVVEKYRIEKIKTIGDAYMCAGGIPERSRANPVEVILAAMEMLDYMTRVKAISVLEGMKYWDIRIGIHTGTVIAGVVGHKKLTYDIWGDTVNIASRMESAGEGGKINISGTTYELIKDFFECEHRGKMPVKYKGDLDMYFVKGILPDLRDENGNANSKFKFRMQLVKLQDVEEKVDKMFTEEAPLNLHFHNAAMARNITNQIDLLSIAENLPEEEFLGLKLASIFLFSGYITDYEKPKEAAFILMEALLPTIGFEEKYIEIAKAIIKNSFEDHYESRVDMILHDARYDYLGRVDFKKLTDRLQKELTEHGSGLRPDEWIMKQEKLLREHDFFTDTGRLLRSVSIEAQIASLIN